VLRVACTVSTGCRTRRPVGPGRDGGLDYGARDDVVGLPAGSLRTGWPAINFLEKDKTGRIKELGIKEIKERRNEAKGNEN
jgi:hypothetical protein